MPAQYIKLKQSISCSSLCKLNFLFTWFIPWIASSFTGKSIVRFSFIIVIGPYRGGVSRLSRRPSTALGCYASLLFCFPAHCNTQWCCVQCHIILIWYFEFRFLQLKTVQNPIHVSYLFTCLGMLDFICTRRRHKSTCIYV